MTQRRASKPKVRSGCTKCKARHVKCDEGKPACARCLVGGRTCAYGTPKSFSNVVSLPRTLAPAPANTTKKGLELCPRRNSAQIEGNYHRSICSVIWRSPQAGVAEAFPVFNPQTGKKIDHYFKYCESSAFGGLLVIDSPLRCPKLKQSNVNLLLDRLYVARGSFPFNSNEMITWLARNSLNQPAILESISVIGACNQAANLLLGGASRRELNEAIRNMTLLRAHTIKSLRTILQNEPTVSAELTILIVGHLLCFEGARGDTVALDVHLDGIKALISSCGGMKQLSNQTLSIVYYCDLCHWLVNGSPPMFSLSPDWLLMTQSKSVLVMINSLPKTVGESFFVCSWSKNFPRELWNLLRSFQQIVSFFEDTKESEVQSFPELNNYLLFSSHQLRSLPCNVMLNPLQESLIISVLIYSLVRIWRFDGCPVLENTHRILEKSLKKSLPIMESDAPGLLFWMMFISAIALRALPSQTWYIEQIRYLAYKLGLRDWRGAKEILEGYFFVDRGSADPANGVWNKVIKHIHWQ